MRAIDADKLFAAFEDADWFDNADRDIAEDLLLDAPVVNQTEQPDTITGLVTCGCGGKAEVGDGNKAFCGRCGITTLEQFTQEDAKSEWNRAMGLLEVEG